MASDLNWRRLKSWRRLLAQALAPASAPGARESVTEVLVEHGPHAVVQAWELVSVLSQRLGWKVQGGTVQTGVEISWRFVSEQGEVRVRLKRLEQGPAEIRHVRLVCRIDNKPAAMNFIVESAERLAMMLEGIDSAPRTMIVAAVAARGVGRSPTVGPRTRSGVPREHGRGPGDGAKRVIT